MQYYIIINGAQMGPYSKEELQLQNLTSATLVWRQGLEEWTPAGNLEELSEVLYANPLKEEIRVENPPVYPPHSPYNPQGNYPYGNPAPNPPYGNPAYGTPNQPQPPYGQPPYNPADYYVPHTSWMAWAIVATVIGFCTTCIGGILGIIAIVNASKAEKFYNMGLRDQGDSANATAKTLTIIALVIDGLGLIGSIAYFALIPTSLFLGSI